MFYVPDVLSSSSLDQAQLSLDNYNFLRRTQLSSVSQILLYLLFLPLSYICTLYCFTKNCIIGILTLSTVNFLNYLNFKSPSYHIYPNAEEKLL